MVRMRIAAAAVMIGGGAAWGLRIVFDGLRDAILFVSQGAPSQYYLNFDRAGRTWAPAIGILISVGVYVLGEAVSRGRDVPREEQHR